MLYATFTLSVLSVGDETITLAGHFLLPSKKVGRVEVLFPKFVTCRDEHLLTANSARTKCVILSSRMDEPTKNIAENDDTRQVGVVLRILVIVFVLD